MPQTQKIVYSAIDEETGREVVGLEFRRGALKEDRVKADEAALLPLFVEFITKAQETA